jgi:outer membrane protein assembly factor BamB
MVMWKNPVASLACLFSILAIVWSSAAARPAEAAAIGEEAQAALEKIGIDKGICVVLGLPKGGVESVVDLARGSDLTVYFQSASAYEVNALRDAAEKAGLLGRSVFADRGDPAAVHLADNLAGAVLVSPSVKDDVAEKEILRVLHPEGKAIVGDKEIVKPFPHNGDAWSHPYHGPDNNPQSIDENIRAPYLTQFMADPKFCPMPEVSVASGGRVYRAFGHISHKANQNAMLNTLICTNAFNGTILWTRPLKEGFMIHRNTMIATPEVFYLADDESCKLIDPRTGEVRDEIVIPDGAADGPVWKWMALVDGVLYALIGGEEINIDTKPSATLGMGHWPWGMWQGHDYADPATNFGFGRNVIAIDLKTKKIIWNHKEKEYLDSRAVCMTGDRIFCHSPEKFLACVDAKTGKLLWRNSDADLLEAIGPNQKAQLYVTGYSTSTYIKSNDKYVFFAGPQRLRLVVASAADGKLAWQKEYGNYQLVLRDDAIYAAGPQLVGSQTEPAALGAKLAYDTGAVLASLPIRRACTRATGTVDSVFYRTSGGTVRFDVNANTANHIAPMRPPCHDGVIVSDGHLYWGPWMCGCQLSLYGHICLGPAGDLDLRPGADESRLESADDAGRVKPLEIKPGDWPAYQGDNRRSSVTQTSIPREISQQWTINLPADAFPTAPVTAGGLVFVGDRNGAVHALDAVDGSTKWQAYTGGPVYFPPAVADGRVFVGSADGRVYAFEAATGRALWSFRAAPQERWIPVYGKLISTWPVAGGVAVENGTVFAAAGIAHYDGTHVYALDAATGKVKWYNDSSGAISEKVQSGASLQGALYLDGGEVRFLGGGAYETARYDQATGKCLNPPRDDPTSQFHTSFYAYYPAYGKYVSLDHTLADGRMLTYDVTYEGSWSDALSLLPALPAGAKKSPKPASRWSMHRRRGQGTGSVWQKPGLRFNGFIVSPDVLVGAGHTDVDAANSSFLAAAKTDDGQVIWSEDLPGPVVKAGTAVNHEGQIIVSLETGQLLCFGGK